MSAVTKALLVLLATVAIALLSPSAASAEQKVTFPATSAGTGAATPIQGYLSRPPGQGPFAAVVVLHSCLGLRADRPAIARMLNGWGYVALFVDDFSTRGLEETCAVDFPEGLADAYGALAYLAGLADVDTTRVAALGYSQGADTALRVSAGEGSFALPKGAGFRTAAAFYPPCENENQEHARLRLPNLILVGGADAAAGAKLSVDLGADPNNCAGCGKACLVLPNADSTCTAGVCGFACQAGYLDCDLQANDGCEVTSATDVQNCGACGAVCSLANANATCTGGACKVLSCKPGFTDCNKNAADGCEVATSTDASNCGGCGFACDAPGVQSKKCVAGACAPACAAGKGDCNGPAPGNIDDGCEATLATDANNCGACGVVCGAGQQCCAGGCQQTSNCALTVGTVTPPAGWRNGGDFLTITGTGFTGGTVKVLIDDGVAPAWAKDASTLYVQTPPHPDGIVDVKITVGADTVVLKNGFSYKALGVSSPWQMKPMAKVRGEIPGVTVMKNGKVLVIGGTTVPDSAGNSLNTAEIYDRLADTVVPANNTMTTPRWRNSGITLLDGRVLVVGGCSGCGGGSALSADLFDPTTNLFSAAAPTLVTRNNTHPVLMPDGRVFVASDTSSVELYDPVKNTWKLIAHAQAHLYGFAVRLRDGRVMLGGGDGGNKVVELFDPVTETFTLTGSLNTGRSMLTAHTLPDGRVIVIGGTNVSAGGVNAPQATMETWSPATGLWTYFPVSLVTPRCWHASALIRDGSILVMGGYPTNGSCTPTAAVEQVDPLAGTVSPFASLGHANTEWSAVTMQDGSVLAVGGGACGQSSALPDLDFLPGAL